jgi:hypothetical protein
MTTRIGLAIARDALRLVVVRRGRVAWAGEAALNPERGLETVIESLLVQAPVRRLSRPVLCAAVGPHASQVKLVTGLPETTDPRTLAAVIRQSAGSFFLKNGAPLLTTGVRPVRAGTAWAAAIDRPCVEAVRDACRARGWRLGIIAPAAISLAGAFESSSYGWTDGKLVLEVARADGALATVRTRPAQSEDQPATAAQPVPALTRLGDHAMRYADAYGATTLDPREPLAVDPDAAGWWSGAEVRRRLALPGVIVVLGITALVLSPLAARLVERRAQARVDEVRPDQRAVIDSALAQLRAVTRVLEATAAFAASRPSITTLLGHLARGLPAGSAVTSLDVNGDRVELVMLSSDPGTAVFVVRNIPDVRAAELVGPVQRGGEGHPDAVAQRLTLRFRIGPPPGSSGTTGDKP